MSPKDAELYRRVEEIVHYVWDPIGVCEIPEASDEYSGYLTGIFARVQAGDIEALLQYMRSAATEDMGLSFERDRAERAANAMLAWKVFLDEDA